MNMLLLLALLPIAVPGFGGARFLVVAILAVAVAGCSHTASTNPHSCPQSGGRQIVSDCINPERYPELLVAGADIASPVLGRITATINFRQGHLSGKDDAEQYLLSILKPLDVLLISSKGKATHQLIPGAFGHVVVYLGSERQIRREGLWGHDDIEPHKAKIQTGNVLIESESSGVHLSTPNQVFNADRIVILRPGTTSRSHRQRLLLDFYRHIGTGFDFHFNAGNDDRLFCAELAGHVLKDQNFPVRQAYGRPTILPDDIIAATLNGRTRMRFVTYVRGSRESWSIGTRQEVVNDLSAAWTTFAATNQR